MEERTAHNGLVAGSNPAKPIKNIMNKNIKLHKLNKTKQYLKNKDLIFFVHTLNLNSKRWLTIKKELYSLGLISYKLNNPITKLALKNSIFINFDALINGSMCFVSLSNSRNNNFHFKNTFNNNKNLLLVNVKLNKKMYSPKQLTKLTTLNYKNNIKLLNNTFKKFLKLPYKSLKN